MPIHPLTMRPRTRTEDLDTAVDAVTTALSALLTEPRSVTVGTAVGRADAAVTALDRDVTSVVLGRLLRSIEDCHRAGVRHSARLDVCRRSTSRALRLDPRWHRAAPLSA